MKHVKKAIPVLLVALSATACSGKKTSAAKMGTVMDSATSSMPMQGSAGMADSAQMGGSGGMMSDTTMKSGSGMARDSMTDPHTHS